MAGRWGQRAGRSAGSKLAGRVDGGADAHASLARADAGCAGGAAARGAVVDCRGAARGRGLARRRQRKGAGLPERQDLFQPGEDARENGGDQGMQGNRQPSSNRSRRTVAAELGQMGGQRGGLMWHSPYNN